VTALNPFTCPHQLISAPRARRYPSGMVQYRRQCRDCGDPVGIAIAKATALQQADGDPAPFDELLFTEGRATASRERGREAEVKRAQWWAWYNQYLESPEWHTRRDKVMKRAGGICEGCLSRRAVHVHHTTYAHVGRELLFELIALCEPCHVVAHGDNPNKIPLAAVFDTGGER
jgi:5-methylcytosine-specific restriction endonuclease McrA